MANLKFEVLFGAVDKLTGPIKTIVGGSKSLSAAYKKTDADLKALQATQKKVDSFRNLQDSISKTTDKLTQYRTEHKLLKDQSKLAPLTLDQTQKLKGLEQGIRRTKNELQSHSSKLNNATRDLNVAGIQVNKLSDSESTLKNKIHLTTMELNKQKDALGKHANAQKTYEKWQNRMSMGKDIAQKGLMVAGAGAVAMAVPVKLSIDFESAMADVKKVVDFDTPQQFKQMENDVLNLSKRLPMAATDIAAIFAAGGQSGIAKNELSQFAETAVKMGVAFDISADESGQAMAEMRTAFKMSQAEVAILADKINYLGNNTPAAAKGIMNIVQRIGPLGEVGGYASGSIAALGATIRGMGVAEEVAATGIKNMMLALVAGESATKSQKTAYKELGLNAGEVAKSMQTDAEGTTLKILELIKALPKEKQGAMLSELFGTESLSAIAPLLTNTDALKENLQKVGDASKYSGSMEAEYAARANTTANKIKLAKNAASALGITIGNQLLPGINSAAESFSKVITSVQEWAQKNPELTATLSKVAVGAIAIVGGLSALSLGLIAIFAPMMMVAKGFSVITTALNIMRIAVMANPIILAVTLMATAAFLIYKNWGPISSFFADLWTGIKAVFAPIGTWFSTKITEVKTAFSGGIAGISALIVNWSPIGLFYTAFAKVLSWFGIDLPAKFTGFGGQILEGLKNGILSKVAAVKAAISGAVNDVIEKARGILGIHSPSRVFMGIGGYTMQGMAKGITQSNNLPLAATATATQGIVNVAAKTTPVKPINIGNRNNPKSYISQDSIEVHIHVKDGSVVKGTAQAMRQELQRVAEEQQMKKRKFLTDTE